MKEKLSPSPIGPIMLNRREFMQTAAASLGSAILSPLYGEIAPEKEEEDSITVLDKFCNENKDSCFGVVFPDLEGNFREATFVDSEDFLDYRLTQYAAYKGFDLSSITSTEEVLRIVQESRIWVLSEAYSADIALIGSARIAVSIESTKFVYGENNYNPNGSYGVFVRNLPDRIPPKGTPTEIVRELEARDYTVEDLIELVDLDPNLRLKMQTVIESSRDGTLTKKPNLIREYFKSLREIINANMINEPDRPKYFPVYSLRGEINRNLLLEGVPRVGDCSDFAITALLFNYWQMREVFDENSSSLIGISKIDKNDGHLLSLLKLKGKNKQGEDLYFLLDNKAMVGLEKIEMGPYHSATEACQAVLTYLEEIDDWKDNTVLRLLKLNDLEEALTDPIIHTRTDISKIGRQIFINDTAKEAKTEKNIEDASLVFLGLALFWGSIKIYQKKGQTLKQASNRGRKRQQG